MGYDINKRNAASKELLKQYANRNLSFYELALLDKDMTKRKGIPTNTFYSTLSFSKKDEKYIRRFSRVIEVMHNKSNRADKNKGQLSIFQKLKENIKKIIKKGLTGFGLYKTNLCAETRLGTGNVGSIPTSSTMTKTLTKTLTKTISKIISKIINMGKFYGTTNNP